MLVISHRRPWLAAAVLSILAVLPAISPQAAGAADHRTERPVFEAADLLDGGGPPTPVGESTLARGPRGLTANLQTTALPPHHALTLWWVVFNDPSTCTAGLPGVSSCGPGDAHSGRGGVSPMHAAGRFANGFGGASFGSHARTGDTSRALAGPGVTAPDTAEVLLVVKTHGERIPRLASEQISTFAGGCDDQSDAPPGAPAELVGPPGDNACAEVQVSVHAPAG